MTANDSHNMSDSSLCLMQHYEKGAEHHKSHDALLECMMLGFEHIPFNIDTETTGWWHGPNTHIPSSFMQSVRDQCSYKELKANQAEQYKIDKECEQYVNTFTHLPKCVEKFNTDYVALSTMVPDLPGHPAVIKRRQEQAKRKREEETTTIRPKKTNISCSVSENDPSTIIISKYKSNENPYRGNTIVIPIDSDSDSETDSEDDKEVCDIYATGDTFIFTSNKNTMEHDSI